MPNNFSTKKDKLATEKIILARINPWMEIIDDLTVLVDGAPDPYTIVGMTLPLPNLVEVIVDQYAYTLVDTLTNVEQYTYNSETGELQIQITGSLNDHTSILASFYLFYTSEIGRYISQDPENSNTEERYWEPKIVGNPSFSVTQEDIIDGFLSVGNSNLTIINHEKDFQQYIGDNFFFSKREIVIWQCLDGVNNIRKLFSGYCSSISIDDNLVRFSIDNLYSAFQNVYLPLSTYELSTGNSTDFIFKDEDKDKFIPKLFCLVTKTIHATNSRSTHKLMTASAWQSYYVFSSGLQAINGNYTSTVSTSTNRRWVVCVESVTASDLTEPVVGATTSSVTVNGSTINLTRITVIDANKYRPGDNITINNVKGFFVIEINTGLNYIYVSGPSAITNGHNIYRPSVSVVQVEVGNDEGLIVQAYLIYGTHYTVQSYQDVRYIELVNNFEADFAFAGTQHENGITPDAIITVRAWNHDTINHAAVVSNLIQSAGLTVNGPSITLAGATDMKTNFTLPYWGETTNPTIADVLQRLLSSTFGMLSINEDFEVEYLLLDNPVSNLEVTENEIIEGSLVQDVDYKDIYTTVTFTNDHGEDMYNNRFLRTRFSTVSEASLTNTQAEMQYGVKKIKHINHVLLNMSESKQKILDILSRRRLKVSFKTKGINFESKVGDDLEIISNKLNGTSGSKVIKIMSIEKSASDTTVRGIDLLGI